MGAKKEQSYAWNQEQRKELGAKIAKHIETSLAAPNLSKEELLAHVDAWKTTITVQMHFNDMEMRIRNFAVTVFAAAVSGAGLALKDGVTVHGLPLGSWILVAAAGSWLMFLFMDRYWYHRLLLGAVYTGAAIESGLRSKVPSFALSEMIKYESPMKVPFTDFAMHSEVKIAVFYSFGIAVMLLGASAIWIWS